MELRSWARLVSGHDTARIQDPPSQPTSGLSHLADRNHCLNYSKPPICHLILDQEQSNHTPKSYMTSWCIADPILYRKGKSQRCLGFCQVFDCSWPLTCSHRLRGLPWSAGSSSLLHLK